MKTNTFSAYWTDKLGAAIREAQTEPYSMSLVGHDAQAVQAAVNQGIDSHLEACFVPARGDSYKWIGSYRLQCSVSPESLPVLVRRLLETGEDHAMSLASSICSTLEIELI